MSGLLNDKYSWSQSLEAWVRESVIHQPRIRKSLKFGPRKVKSARGYDTLPAVMVVSSAATRNFHRPLFEAIELLEKASGAFKVVLFSESGSESIAKDFDWPVEHCFRESAWWSLSDRNWLDMAGSRVEWARRMYGTSFVFAARSVNEAVAELANLGAFLGLDRLLVSTAQTHLECNGLATDSGIHPWLRGWLDSVPTGETSHRIDAEPFSDIEVMVVNQESQVALVADDADAYGLRDDALERGWNLVTFRSNSAPVQSDAEFAMRRAICDGFDRPVQTYQIFAAPIKLWNSELGTAAISRSFDGTWEVTATGGFRIRRETERSLTLAVQNFSTAHLASSALGTRSD